MINIRPLPEDLQKVAIEELDEVPDRIASDIEALKTWIEQQPHLNARTDDQFLVAFLRGCKFSLEKAKSKIENYYTLRTKYPDFYTIQDVDSPRLLELMKYGVGINLPMPLNGNGPRITYIRAGHYPADKFKFEEVMCIAHSMQEIELRTDDYAVVNGFINLLDMTELSAAHMFQMTPTIVKKMSTFAEDALPLRQKGTHFIHTPKGFDTIFNMFKPLMPLKQQERLYVHGERMDELYKHIPQKYLPIELGGENGSIEELVNQQLKLFGEYRNYFIEDLQYRNNEKLRPGKGIDYDNIFGVDGSFRKINVD